MGQGGYIYVANVTPHQLKRVGVHSYQMKSWDDSLPEVIEAGSSPRLYVEFSEGLFQVPGDDTGEAEYAIGDTGKRFTLKASYRNLGVDWQNSEGDGFVVFPRDGMVGWMHDGSVNVLIAFGRSSA